MRTRVGLGVAVTALGVVALVGLIGNSALAASNSAAQAGNWRSLGEAQLAVHDRAAARRSLRKAIAKDRNDWIPRLDLAAASSGDAQLTALVEASRLNPLSPEIAPILGAVLRP
jgi:Flp pilus assembly protein TadD